MAASPPRVTAGCDPSASGLRLRLPCAWVCGGRLSLPCAFVSFWLFYLIPAPPSFLRDKFKVDNEAPLMSIQTGNLQFLTCFVESRQTVSADYSRAAGPAGRGLLKKLVSLSRCVSGLFGHRLPRPGSPPASGGVCPPRPLSDTNQDHSGPFSEPGGLGGDCRRSLTRPSVTGASLPSPPPRPSHPRGAQSAHRKGAWPWECGPPSCCLGDRTPPECSAPPGQGDRPCRWGDWAGLP